MPQIELTIYGVPVAKGRARHHNVTTKGGQSFTSSYTPKKTKQAEESFLLQAISHKPPQPITVPVRMRIRFVMPVPKSTSKKMTSQMLETTTPHVKRPDLDNLNKLVLDSLNSVFWRDDSQVWSIVSEKAYGESPRTEVTIEWKADE